MTCTPIGEFFDVSLGRVGEGHDKNVATEVLAKQAVKRTHFFGTNI